MTNQKNKSKMQKNQEVIKEVELPGGVTASLTNNSLSIKGPKGEVIRLMIHKNLSVSVGDKKILVKAASSKKEDKKSMGSLIAHIKNMVRGSQQAHVYILKVCSGHFPMNISVGNNKFTVKNFLGEKVPRTLHLKPGADVKVEGDHVYVSSLSKELAGQTGADIEQLTRRPGYDSRVFQDGIWMISKDGKEIK